MTKFKRVFSFILLMLVSASGLLFGCKGKYDDMKLVSSADSEKEIVLYVPNLWADGTQEGTNSDSTKTVTYTVEGAKNGVSTDIDFIYERSGYIDVTWQKDATDSRKTIVTITAKKPTSTAFDFVAKTKEGEKTNTLKIRCEKRVESIEATGKQYAIANIEGQTLQLESAKFLSFKPQDTTERNVKYSTTEQGVSLSETGLLTLTGKLGKDQILVTATSTENANVSTQFAIKVIDVVSANDISISTDLLGDIALDFSGDTQGSLELYSNATDRGSQILTTTIASAKENFAVDYSLQDKSVALVDNISDVYVDSNNNMSTSSCTISKNSETESGETTLTITITYPEYQGLDPVFVKLKVKAKKLALSMEVVYGMDGNKTSTTTAFDLSLSTFYANSQNGLPITINIEKCDDMRFFLATEDASNLIATDQNGAEIAFATYNSQNTNPNIYDDSTLSTISLLDSGSTIYLRGTESGETQGEIKLVIYAYGSRIDDEFRTSLSAKCTTYLTANNLKVNFKDIIDENDVKIPSNNTIFVQVGKQTVVDYNALYKSGNVSHDGDARGVKLEVESVSTSIKNHIDIEYQEPDSAKPMVVLNGLRANNKNQYIYAHLLLENGKKSETFKIFVFEEITSFVVDIKEQANVSDKKTFSNLIAGTKQTLSGFSITLPDKDVPVSANLDVSCYASDKAEPQIPYGIEYASKNESIIKFANSSIGSLEAIGYNSDGTKIFVTIETLHIDESGDVHKKTLGGEDEYSIIVKTIQKIDSGAFKLQYRVNQHSAKDLSNDVYEFNDNFDDDGWRDVDDEAVKIYWNYFANDSFGNTLVQLRLTYGGDYDSAIFGDEDLSITWNLPDQLTRLDDGKAKNFLGVAADETAYTTQNDINYAQIPQSKGYEVKVFLNYYDSIISKKCTVNIQKPVNPTYVRLEKQSFDTQNYADYDLSVVDDSNYSITVQSPKNTNNEIKLKLFAKAYSGISNVDVTNKNILWKVADTVVTLEDLATLDSGASLKIYKGDVEIGSIAGITLDRNNYSVIDMTIMSNVMDGSVAVSFSPEDSQRSTVKKTLTINVVNGTESAPNHIKNETDLAVALQSTQSEYFVFDNDITIDAITQISNTFVGHIDGNGKTLSITNATNPLVATLAKGASVRNLNIVVSDALSLSGDYAAIAKDNNGVLQNITILFEQGISSDQNYTGIVDFGALAVANSGTIEDCSVTFAGEVNINTQSYFGGITATNSESGAIKSSAVEAKKDISVTSEKSGYDLAGGICGTNSGTIESCSVIATKISGTDFVGGIAGQTTGGRITSSFARAIKGNIQIVARPSSSNGKYYAGGLVGQIGSTRVQKCFANADIFANQTTNANGIAGGLVGLCYATSNSAQTYIAKSYMIGSINATVAGAIIGEVADSQSGVEVSEVYAVCTGAKANADLDFVGSGDAYIDRTAILAKNNPDTLNDQKTSTKLKLSEDDLKNADTYNNYLSWDVSEKSSDWHIDSLRNGGYPVLVSNGNILDDTQVSTFVVEFSNSNYKVIDGKIYLPLSKQIKLIDLFTIKINGKNVTKTSLYRVLANANSIVGNLSTQEASLLETTYIQSSTPKVVNLSFKSLDNSSVSTEYLINGTSAKDLAIVFAEQFENVSANVVANIGEKKQVEFSYSKADYLAVGTNLGGDIYIDIVNLNSDENGITVSQTDEEEAETVVDGKTYYKSGLKLSGSKAGTYSVAFNLYQKIGDKYIKLNSQDALLMVSIINNTTKIVANQSSAFVTPSTESTFSIDIYTTDTDVENVLRSIDVGVKNIDSGADDSSTIYIADSSDVASVPNTYKLMLEVLGRPNYDHVNKFCTITYNLKFNPAYLDLLKSSNLTNFENIEYNAKLSFTSKDSEASTSIVAYTRLQSVSRIDVSSYPIAQSGNSYTIAESHSINMVAGGMMMFNFDIYPEYSYFDRVEVTSSVDGSGNRFDFIQLAKDGKTSSKYYETKPNAQEIENGVRLYRVSAVDGSTQTFDGNFYLAGIVLQSVSQDQDFVITIAIYKSSTDKNPKTKQISVRVYKTPDISLSISNEQRDIFGTFDGDYRSVYSNGDDIQLQKEIDSNGKLVQTNGRQHTFYLLARGTSINLSKAYGFAPVSERLNIVTFGANAGSKNNYYEKSVSNGSTMALTYVKDSAEAQQGDIIAVQLVAEKSIVGTGLTYTYSSDWIYFYVVDFIVESVQINGGSPLQIYLNQGTPLTAVINAIYADKGISDVFDGATKKTKKLASFNKECKYGETAQAKITEIQNAVNNSSQNASDDATYSNYWWSTKSGNASESATNGQLVSTYYKVFFGPYEDNDKSVSYGKAGNNIYVVGTQLVADGTVPSIYFQFKYGYDAQNKFVYGNKETANKELSVEVQLDILSDTNPDNPFPIYTIENFYSMQAGMDYILMNDFWFGNDKSVPDGTIATADTYIPFDFVSKSLDGNSHTITLWGDNTQFGLFSNIASGSMVRNINVVYDHVPADAGSFAVNANTYTIDANETQLNIGGFAHQNAGIVTNSCVEYKTNIQFKIQASDSQTISTHVAGFVSSNSGKITYSTVTAQSGKNKNIYLMAGYNNNGTDVAVSMDMACFVNTNNNLISNCQAKYVGLKNISSERQTKMTAGFANTNSGKIYASSVSGQEYMNDVGTGEKAKQILPMTSTSDTYFATLESNYQIAGFVSLNSGEIRDCYSAIPMTTTQSTSGFVFDNSTGGGTISTSYTMSTYHQSTSTSNNMAHTAFVGYDVLAGKILCDQDSDAIKNCFYFATSKIDSGDSTSVDPASFVKLDNNAVESVFYSAMITFDIAKADEKYSASSNTEDKAPELPQKVWGFVDGKIVPVLLENIYNDAIHNKYKRVLIYKTEQQGGVENSSTIDTAQSTDDTSSSAMTSRQTYIYGDASADYAIGQNIPKQVSVSSELTNMFSGSSTIVKKLVRLIDDIDLSQVSSDVVENLTKATFIGNFDGNGMTLSGINLASTDSSSAPFGLFSQIGDSADVEKASTVVKNLSLSVTNVSNPSSVSVGALAGVVVNTQVKNVDLTSANSTNTSAITGKNLTGGLFGLVIGNSSLSNVSSTASAISVFNTKGGDEKQFPNLYLQGDGTNTNYKLTKYGSTDTTIALQTNDKFVENLSSILQNLSYAGGIAGVVDISVADYAQISYPQNETSDNSYWVTASRTANIKNATVSGDVTISAYTAGGLFGFAGKNAYLYDGNFVVSESDTQRISGGDYAGGLVGENHGVIEHSSINVELEQVSSHDSVLTNTIGENLFADSQKTSGNTDQLAIGGVVGKNVGGAILHSYSKTNVINLDATYVGGLAGDVESTKTYAQTIGSNHEFKIVKGSTGNGFIRNVKFSEVYTNGNVFAGDRSVKGDDYKSANNAGGAFGKYIFTSGDEIAGMVLANGFHMPSAYALPTDRSDSAIKYSDIAKGFDGTITNSAGIAVTTTYKPVVSAFAGYLYPSDSSEEIKFDDDYCTLFANFVYNGKTITFSDCVNANGGILPLAGGAEDVVLSGINQRNHYKADNQASKMEIYLNSLNSKEVPISNSIDYVASEGKYYVPSNLTYLVLRGDSNLTVQVKSDVNTTRQLSSFAQDKNGVYKNWSDWSYKKPIYPDFVKRYSYEYIEVWTEDDLKKIDSYKNYILMKDIYLTDYWSPKVYTYGKFTSQKRQDNNGINGSAYYSIYNININDDSNKTATGDKVTENQSYCGFFRSISNAEVTNINFVYGTKYNTSSDFAKGLGVSLGVKDNNVNDNVTDFGLVAGQETQNSTIAGCRVYVASNSSINVTAKKATGTFNFGGLVGTMSDGSVVSNCALHVVESPSEGDDNANFDANSPLAIAISNGKKVANDVSGANAFNFDFSPIEKSIVNVGGFVANVQNSCSVLFAVSEIPALNFSNMAITFGSEESTKNIGGFVGSIGNTDDKGKKAIIMNVGAEKDFVGAVYTNAQDFANIKIILRGNTNGDLNFGGFVGQLTNFGEENTALCASNITLQNDLTTSGTANVGGFAGNVTFGKNATVISHSSSKKVNVNAGTATNVGGFAGLIKYADADANGVSAKSTITNCFAQNAMVTGTATNVGGFVGEIDDTEKDMTIDDCYSSGAITTDGTSVGGFVATLASTQNAISNCLSDVKITTTAGDNTIAGFVANAGGNSITKSIAMGYIKYATEDVVELSKTPFAGNAYGFVAEGTNKVTGYAFVTMLVFGDNVGATIKDKDVSKVQYAYNVSGVFESQQEAFKSLSYKDVVEMFKNDATGSKYIPKISKIFADSTKTSETVNAYLYTQSQYSGTNSLINPTSSLADVTNNGMHYAILNSEDKRTLQGDIPADTFVISANLCQFDGEKNQPETAPTIQVSANHDNNGYVSGVEFRRSDGYADASILRSNNGYVFNSVLTGKTVGSGVVATNNGIFNAVGSNANIFTSGIASGFVSTNNGIVANSYAVNNVYSNGDNTTSIASNSNIAYGFVQTNNGTIKNSYASINAYGRGIVGFGSGNGTFGNCYYDQETSTSDSSGTSKSYGDLHGNNTNNTKILTNFTAIADYSINYGYPIPYVFVGVQSGDAVATENCGTISTGKNNENSPIILHTLGELQQVGGDSHVTDVLYLKMISNIDAHSKTLVNITHNAGITLANEQKTYEQKETYYGLYNIKTESGMFNSTNSNGKINISSLIVTGTIAKPSTDVGLVVGSAKGGLTAENVDVTVDAALELNNKNINFGTIAGYVENGLSLTNCTMKGNDKTNSYLTLSNFKTAGGAVGYTNSNSVKITNCTANKIFETVSPSASDSSIGGLIGELIGSGTTTISGCDISKNAIAVGGAVTNVGGFVGKNSKNLEIVQNAKTNDPIVLNSISANSTCSNVGGLVGSTTKTLTIGSNVQLGVGTTSLSGDNVGGLVGYLQNCSLEARELFVSDSDHDLTLSGTNVGGLVGKMENKNAETQTISGIVNCPISAIATYAFGGIVGSAENCSITDSASIGTNAKITQKDTSAYAGGIAGYLKNVTVSGQTISTTLTLNGTYVGGIVGSANESTIGSANKSTISNVSVGENAALTLNGTYVGGIVGKPDDETSISTATVGGNITSTLSGELNWFGGIAGTYGNGNSSMTDVSVGTVTFEITNDITDDYDYSKTGVGGLVGWLKNASSVAIKKANDNCSSATIQFTNKASRNTAYVGGIVGVCETTGTITATNNGKVLAKSSATKQYDFGTTKIQYNATTWNTVVTPESDTWGNLKYLVTKGQGNYQTKDLTIPLFCGGMFGNLKSIASDGNNLQNKTKAVRALLTNANENMSTLIGTFGDGQENMYQDNNSEDTGMLRDALAQLAIPIYGLVNAGIKLSSVYSHLSTRFVGATRQFDVFDVVDDPNNSQHNLECRAGALCGITEEDVLNQLGIDRIGKNKTYDDKGNPSGNGENTISMNAQCGHPLHYLEGFYVNTSKSISHAEKMYEQHGDHIRNFEGYYPTYDIKATQYNGTKTTQYTDSSKLNLSKGKSPQQLNFYQFKENQLCTAPDNIDIFDDFSTYTTNNGGESNLTMNYTCDLQGTNTGWTSNSVFAGTKYGDTIYDMSTWSLPKYPKDPKDRKLNTWSLINDEMHKAGNAYLVFVDIENWASSYSGALWLNMDGRYTVTYTAYTDSDHILFYDEDTGYNPSWPLGANEKVVGTMLPDYPLKVKNGDKDEATIQLKSNNFVLNNYKFKCWAKETSPGKYEVVYKASKPGEWVTISSNTKYFCVWQEAINEATVKYCKYYVNYAGGESLNDEEKKKQEDTINTFDNSFGYDDQYKKYAKTSDDKDVGDNDKIAYYQQSLPVIKEKDSKNPPEDKKITSIVPYTRYGYTFAGWASENEIKKAIGSNNTKLLADYSKANKFIDSSPDPVSLYATKSNKGYYNEVDNNYMFKLYNDTSKKSLDQYLKEKDGEGNIVGSNGTTFALYAVWTPTNYKITTNLNGGTAKDYNIESDDLTIPVPTKDGYTFKGWEIKNDAYGDTYTGENIVDSNGTLTIKKGTYGNITLTANWEPTKYSITTNLNGGAFAEGENIPESYSIESGEIKLPTPIRVGYDFDGWFTTPDFAEDTQIKTISYADDAKDISVYAKWAPISYTITIDMNMNIEDSSGKTIYATLDESTLPENYESITTTDADGKTIITSYKITYTIESEFTINKPTTEPDVTITGWKIVNGYGDAYTGEKIVDNNGKLTIKKGTYGNYTLTIERNIA